MTHQHPKIIIVIPVYNHSQTLGAVVRRARQVHEQVLVVNDGSTDQLAEVISGLDVRVLHHPKNMGKGAAIITGAKEALRQNMTHIVTIDADGQHDPADFLCFVPIIQDHPHAIIVGKRRFEQTLTPKASVFGRSFSNFWLRLHTGQTLGDTQSGFRAYPLAVLQGLTLKESRYAFEVEVLVKAAWAGIKLRDVDISVHYPPPGKRITHFRRFMDNLRLTRLNTFLTLRSIAPIPHKKILFNHQKRQVITVRHPLKSVKALLTENTSPKKLAAAGGMGVFLGALPLIACHSIVIIFAAGFFRFNKIAALTASQMCMPPIVPALCIEAGYFMRNGRFLTEISLETLGYQALERLYEWLLGSFVIGPVLALLVGLIIYIMAQSVIKGTRAVRPSRQNE